MNADDIGRKHDTYVARFLKGELIEQLLDVMMNSDNNHNFNTFSINYTF